MYQALYRKWRPKTFDEVTGQTHITDTLKTQVAAGRLSHAYLFTGTRGTGKTTCAKILARAVNCEHPVNGNPCNECPSCRGILDGSILDVLELDAASNNGVDQVRALRDEAIYSPTTVKKRVYIIDEVHMLTPAASNALLKIMEEPPEHLMFILATTELHKILPTILSRCQRFSFKRLRSEDIVGRLRFVAGQEQIDLTLDGASLLARLADGGMRDALSLLDQCAATSGTIDRPRVLDVLGLAGNLKTAHIFNAIRKGDAGAAVSQFGELYDSGKDVSTVLSELISLSRDLLIRQTAPDAGSGLLAGGYDEETLKTLCKNMPPERLIAILERLEEAADACKRSGSSRTTAELCLIRLCDPSLDGSTSGLAARIARLEGMIAQGILMRAAAPADAPTDLDAPPVYDEAPPWYEDEPPVSGAPIEPPVQAAPAPQKQSPAQKPAADGRWSDLIDALKGRLPMTVYPLLKMPGSAAAQWNGDVLTIFIQENFVYSLANTPANIQIIAETASAQAGHAVRVELREGAPSAQPTAPKAAQASAPGSVSDLVNFMQQHQQ